MGVDTAEPALQQLQLLRTLIAKHQLLPAMVEVVPAQAQLVQPTELAVSQR
jgi:hypothetical protein